MRVIWRNRWFVPNIFSVLLTLFAESVRFSADALSRVRITGLAARSQPAARCTGAAQTRYREPRRHRSRDRPVALDRVDDRRRDAARRPARRARRRRAAKP